MSAALRKQYLKTRKDLSIAKLAVGSQIERIRQTALAILSDRELRQLQGGLPGKAGASAAEPDPATVARYRTACEAVAVRFTGRSCPALELPSGAVTHEIANRNRSKLRTMFPDEGEYRRALYPKQLEFFRAGRDHREVAFIAGNRCGKSEAGAYQTALHLTGLYPDWWEGRRFEKPVNVWVASDTNQTTRDILQAKLLGGIVPGPKGSPDQTTGLGTGMIPADTIMHTQPNSSMPGAIETAHIRHISGKCSRLTFKSYQHGREAFQGTEQDLIVCDEEPPMQVYAEALTRTMATGTFQGGLILLLFTPLNGWSEVVESFLNPEKCAADRYCVQAGWDHVPHLSAAEKESMLAAYPLYQRDP